MKRLLRETGPRVYLIAVLLFFALFSERVHASDSLLGWLLYASNDRGGASLPAVLARFDRRLPQALGYSHLRVLADGRITVTAEGQRFLIFTADLKILLTDLRHQKGDDYLVGLQLFQADQPVLETQVKVSRGSPLFIRGPGWRDGQVIVAVMVTP